MPVDIWTKNYDPYFPKCLHAISQNTRWRFVSAHTWKKTVGFSFHNFPGSLLVKLWPVFENKHFLLFWWAQFIFQFGHNIFSFLYFCPKPRKFVFTIDGLKIFHPFFNCAELFRLFGKHICWIVSQFEEQMTRILWSLAKQPPCWSLEWKQGFTDAFHVR